MDEVIREILRGNGFHSAYYSESGKDSYLLHHFSPGLVFYLPFAGLFPDRVGYAIGCYTYTVLGLFGWGFLLYKESVKKESPSHGAVFWILWIALLNQLYIYRLGTSYHFEVLVLPFSALFFYFYLSIRDKNKTKSIYLWSGLFISLALFLSVKEDVGVYIGLFAAVSWFGEWFSGRKIPFYKNIRFNSLPFGILILSISYFLFAFWIYPHWVLGNSTISWSDELSREYVGNYKKVEGIEKTVRIFLEIAVSGGLGILSVVPEGIAWGLIYLTHAISSRPWHHEIYSYYSYTLLPFVLFSGVVWLRNKKEIPYWGFFLIVGLIFYKNSLDGNYPLHFQKESIQTEIQLQQKQTERTVQTELLESKKSIPNNGVVYSQYNLSFYVSKEIPVRPIRLFESECFQEQIGTKSTSKQNLPHSCYVILSPDFTEPVFHPKEELLRLRAKLLEKKAELIYEGNLVEVWNYSFK
ncbi:hypothetical protein LPTSP3_g27650 [Leptospira kobayashii]|uniref:DUF2079 domain-containing protein n=2 Tax=Leptospira kobayashii TaxID=1917830 RepID=A0ABN6KFG4_9LEPT|nr:hypothetical protein LPTSP3_g27650 [Leptospira kobayashii]